MPTARPLLFLHGLESGPVGRKSQALAAAFGPPLAPDTTGVLDPTERLARILAATADVRDAVVVGSSFGGLMAVLLADRHPERCRSLVLLAPALYGPRVAGIAQVPPAVIVHGRQDAVVPYALSEAFAARTGATLIPRDDGHSLAASLDVMIDHVRAALAAS